VLVTSSTFKSELTFGLRKLDQRPPTNARSWDLLEVTMGRKSVTQRKERMGKKRRERKRKK
jgi:hypothetical protein